MAIVHRSAQRPQTKYKSGEQVAWCAFYEREELPEDRVLQEQIEKLNQIGIALSSEIEIEKLLELILYESREFTGADGGSLYILDQDRLYFHVTQNDTLSQRPDPPPGFKPYPLPLSKKSIAGYVAITGQALNIKNVYDLPETVPYEFNPEFDLRNDYVTRSMLVVPMKDTQGQILGVLQLINAKDETGVVIVYPKSVEDLVMSLASQAAVAIRNARLIADIKALFEALIRYSASAIDARSPHTAGHSRRVAAYSKAIALAINAEATGPLQHVFFTPASRADLNNSSPQNDHRHHRGVALGTISESTKFPMAVGAEELGQRIRWDLTLRFNIVTAIQA